MSEGYFANLSRPSDVRVIRRSEGRVGNEPSAMHSVGSKCVEVCAWRRLIDIMRDRNGGQTDLILFALLTHSEGLQDKRGMGGLRGFSGNAAIIHVGLKLSLSSR